MPHSPQKRYAAGFAASQAAQRTLPSLTVPAHRPRAHRRGAIATSSTVSRARLPNGAWALRPLPPVIRQIPDRWALPLSWPAEGARVGGACQAERPKRTAGRRPSRFARGRPPERAPPPPCAFARRASDRRARDESGLSARRFGGGPRWRGSSCRQRPGSGPRLRETTDPAASERRARGGSPLLRGEGRYLAAARPDAPSGAVLPARHERASNGRDGVRAPTRGRVPLHPLPEAHGKVVWPRAGPR